MRRAFIATVVLVLAAVPGIADAQGRGRPKAPRTSAGPTTGTTNSSPADSGSGGAVAGSVTAAQLRQFGVWLDDASTRAQGHGSVGIGASYWRGGGASLLDVPVIDGSIGLTDQVQFGASVPFYTSQFAGSTFRGLDDVYLNAKVAVIDPDLHDRRFGLAVIPVVEILSASYTDDRVHWALPVSLEFRASPVRVYGSAGYFSRGAAFGAGALEWASSRGTIVTGSLTQSFSTTDATSTLSAGRADVSLAVSQSLSDAVSAYVSVGRSLSSADSNGTSLGLGGGISVSFSPRPATP